jgi:hypothetical protein
MTGGKPWRFWSALETSTLLFLRLANQADICIDIQNIVIDGALLPAITSGSGMEFRLDIRRIGPIPAPNQLYRWRHWEQSGGWENLAARLLCIT